MGILEIVTIVFVVLKLLGVIDWSWWLVLLPTIISVVMFILWFTFLTVFVATSNPIKRGKR